ncbi:hypothetical protein BXZ70DRAFT_900026, partial [Cristinia sonorae]
TIYMGFVSFMILVWDHIITLADEVEYIWKGKKGPIVWLFFINRYLSPLGFIVNLFAYMSPTWTPEPFRCQHFVRYEGSMTVIGLNVTALMMLLRVYGMYPSNRYVMAFVSAAFVVELTVNAWLLTHGIACTMIFSADVCVLLSISFALTTISFESVSSPAHLASASAWLPLTYDTIVVILTLNRTLKPVRHHSAGKIMRVLLRDGLLYYSVIFSVNLVLTLMIALAPEGIQNITAHLTVAMMSRITLHLKKQGRLHEVIDWDSGGMYTFRGGIASTIHNTRLHFTRSHHTQPSQRASSPENHSRPTQVTVTIDELVTRDGAERYEEFLDIEDDAEGTTREPSLKDPSEATKHVEWHELTVMNGKTDQSPV